MPGRDNDEICQRYAIPKLEQVSIMYKALRSKYGTLQGWSKISISHQPTVWIWFGLTDEVFIVKKKNNNNVIKSEGRKKTEKPRDNSDLTYTLRFKGSLKEFEIELSGMNIHCTINHNGQKTLHETAGGKKEKTEAWVGVSEALQMPNSLNSSIECLRGWRLPYALYHSALNGLIRLHSVWFWSFPAKATQSDLGCNGAGSSCTRPDWHRGRCVIFERQL